MVVAKWTGSAPCLCNGEWKLYINGIDHSDKIPSDKINIDMDTYGFYNRWYFDDDWSEHWESYEAGLHEESWIAENPWVKNIPANPGDVFRAFQAADWRPGSCGGCV